MDIGQLYMASPDWIKGLMVILPHVTLYATARLFLRRPPPPPVLPLVTRPPVLPVLAPPPLETRILKREELERHS